MHRGVFREALLREVDVVSTEARTHRTDFTILFSSNENETQNEEGKLLSEICDSRSVHSFIHSFRRSVCVCVCVCV